jgi:hypothetical protein
MTQISLRKFPYPFRAALTICSDIDGTDTAEKFLAIQNFLNTERQLDIGPGIGLEIGNTFYPLSPNGSFSYLSSGSADRELIGQFIKAGYIDCIHSYGDHGQSRQDALKTIEALEYDGCKVKVWVDHAHIPTNFGPDNSAGLGDVVGSPAYHADLTLAYGIKFAWMGRATSIVGQETPITLKALGHIFDSAHPRASLENIYRELVKIILAKAGNQRFAIHRHNRLLRVADLRDGQQVYEFNRCNNHWHKPLPSSPKLAYVLRPEALATLKAAQGYMLIYTHLGFGDGPPFLPLPTQMALRNLAAEYQTGHIYVTTTVRLLTYCLVHQYLDWSYQLKPDHQAQIVIHRVADPISGPRMPTLEELQGITFYVPDCDKVSVFLGETPILSLQRNPKDLTGQSSVMIPRTYLTYPLS